MTSCWSGRRGPIIESAVCLGRIRGSLCRSGARRSKRGDVVTDDAGNAGCRGDNQRVGRIWSSPRRAMRWASPGKSWPKGWPSNVPSFAAMQSRLPQDYQADRRAGPIWMGYMNFGLPETGELAIVSFRDQLMPVIKLHKARADDSALVDFARLALDQFIALGERNPTLCYQYAEGVGAADISSELPPALIQRELVLGERVIVTSAPRLPVNAQVVGTLKMRVYTRLVQAVGAWRNPGRIASSSRCRRLGMPDYCAVTTAMWYREILAMRPAEAALIMRSFETHSRVRYSKKTSCDGRPAPAPVDTVLFRPSCLASLQFGCRLAVIWHSYLRAHLGQLRTTECAICRVMRRPGSPCTPLQPLSCSAG